jgi:hypothetical protein
MTDKELMQQALECTPHKQLINELLDSRIPKTEREHSAAREIEKLRKRLEQPEQEPVAWRYDLKLGGSFAGVSTEYSRVKLSIGENWTPLYTAPPQCKPLTEEDDRLIAAAPDLLAAMQGLLRGIFDGPDEANEAMLIAKARDAVNKATGEK